MATDLNYSFVADGDLYLLVDQSTGRPHSKRLTRQEVIETIHRARNAVNIGRNASMPNDPLVVAVAAQDLDQFTQPC